MKLKVYTCASDVPKKYHKELRKLGLKNGSIRWLFFDDLDSSKKKSYIHEIIIAVKDDTPVAWGLMLKGDRFSYKNAMFYTKMNYRRQGLASKIYNTMCKNHKKFIVFPDSRNKGFFEYCGRNVRQY